MRRIAPVISVVALALITVHAASVTQSATAQGATPAACAATTEAENEATARRWFEEAINSADLVVRCGRPGPAHAAWGPGDAGPVTMGA